MHLSHAFSPASRRLGAGALSFLFIGAAATWAQPAGADSTPIELSPFEVSAANDDGYIARNSLGASGMNIAIKDLPQSIEVFTSEMIADLGAVQLDEVLRTSASYTPFEHDAGGIAAPTIRGFANSFTLRDGFRVRNGGSDTFNMDRVEIIKGAAAVLYGVSEPGGMVNFTVKKPQSRDFANFAIAGGSYDFKRATLDVNQHVKSVGGGLGVRLLGVWQDAGSPIPWAENDQIFISPKVTWRPFESLRIDVGYEYSRRDALFAGRMPNYTSRVTLPDGTTANRRFLYPAERFDFGWDSQGPDAYSKREQDLYTLGAEWRVHPTTIVRANYQQSKVFTSMFSRGGTNTSTTGGDFSRYPGGVNPAPNEPRNIDGAYNHNASRSEFVDWRVEALTTLESRLGKHDFFYGWEQNQEDQTYLAQVVPASSRVQSSSRPVFVDWLDYVTIDQLREILSFPDGPTPQTEVPAAGMISRTGAAYLMTRHEVLNNRFLLSAGWRFDEDNNGEELLGIDGLNHVGQYGVVARVTEKISIYGLYNESFITQSPASHAGVLLPTSDGSLDIAPATGLTRELGVKADYGKYAFSASVFEIRSGGRVLKLERDPGSGGNNPEDFYTALAGLDRSTGLELSGAATLFSGYQVTGSYVHQNARIVEDTAFPQNNGKTLRSSPQDSFALQNRYQFDDGFLKGVSLGFGVRYSSETQMELPDSSGQNDTKIRPAYTTWNAFTAYRTRLFDHPVSLRLTVNNLLNDKYYLERNRLANPREWRLSLDTRF